MEANASRQTATDWNQGIIIAPFFEQNFCLDSIILYQYLEYSFKYFVQELKHNW